MEPEVPTSPVAPGGAAPEPRHEGFAPGQVERLALRGAILLALRSLGLLFVTAAGTIVLARLLTPRDYGMFAIALAVQQVARSMTELGLPVPVVRAATPPTAYQQKVIMGFALALGGAATAAVGLVALVALPAFGVHSETAVVVALASTAIPIFSFRMVPMILIERRLLFGRIVAVETAETIAFYVFAVPAAAAGLGALSLAGAIPVAAAVGAVAATVAQPWAFGVRWNLGVIKPFARFGAQVGATYPVQLLRELGALALLAAIGGHSLAGYYSFSQRIFSIPIAVMTSLQRVGIPALSRIDPGESRSHRAATAVIVAIVPASFVIGVTTGAIRPTLAIIFGSTWMPTADVVIYSSLGWLLAATVGATLSSLAMADGDGRTPLLAGSVGAIVHVALVAVVARPLGPAGAGLAAGFGMVATSAVLVLRTTAGRSAVAPAARASVVAAGTAAAGLAAARGYGAVDLVISVVAACITWVALSLAISRSDLRVVGRVIARHLHRRR